MLNVINYFSIPVNHNILKGFPILSSNHPGGIGQLEGFSVQFAERKPLLFDIF